MKKGKDEGKVMSPLFPRLHVNDTEKGGPRAPPRNKMALYEQLSVPKVHSRSKLILPPPPPTNSSSLVYSAPSTSGSGLERNMVTPFCCTPTSAHAGSSFRDEILESSKRARTFPTEENKRSKYFHDSLCQGSTTIPENAGLPDPSKTIAGGYAFSLPKPSVFDDHRRSRRSEHENEEQKESESSQMGSFDLNGHVSDANMVESMLGFDISPDDVVGIIGHKHFWKTRNAIVNQQRVFAVQVFELHRLIKVQRLIAGSPEELLDNKFHLVKPSSPMKKFPLESPAQKLSSESVEELQYQSTSPGVASLKQNSNSEVAIDDAAGNLPLASPVDADKTDTTPQTNQRPLENQPPVATTYMQPTSWCVPPSQGNQWLVPVMSPSEGLIYKPYTGRSPPTPGLMSHAYGNYRPINLTPSNGDFFKTAFGIPISHQRGIGFVPSNPLLGQTYFQPYDKSLVNPSSSGSAIELMNRSIADQSSKLNSHVSPMDVSASVQSVHYQSLGNMPSQKSGGGISGCFGTSLVSKSSELQLSTASTLSERAQADALPLFPVAPKAQKFIQPDQIHGTEKQTRAIKVVPHKHKSATESAARIFRSIQEERNQRNTHYGEQLKH